jgi:hypothetical protein
MVIIAIRMHTKWNSKRIATEMTRRGIYRVSPDHIDQLFHALGYLAIPPRCIQRPVSSSSIQVRWRQRGAKGALMTRV